jgi:hypothetical protein
MKRQYWFIGVLGVILIIGGLIGRLCFIYNTHSTIQKTLNLRDYNMKTINFSLGKVVIHDSGTELQAYYLKKEFWGWKKIMMVSINKKTSSPSGLINFLTVNEETLLLGYFSSNNIKSVTFTDTKYGLSITSTIADTGAWYIPYNNTIPLVNKDNLTILTNDGRTLEYPFEGLETDRH